MATKQTDAGFVTSKELRKCNHCYVSNTVKPLQKCSRCKAMAYCSKECQKADWKSHKQNCANNERLAQALKEHASTPLGMMDSLLLPDGVSLFELDQRLEKWVKFHQPLLMWSVLHSLALPSDLALSRRQVLFIKLRPRHDHGRSPGKYFRAVDAYAVNISEAMGWDAPWPESLSALQQMREDSERMGRGSVAAAMVECRPLAVQTVPFGSLADLSDTRVMSNWKETLMKEIENGNKPFKNRR